MCFVSVPILPHAQVQISHDPAFPVTHNYIKWAFSINVYKLVNLQEPNRNQEFVAYTPSKECTIIINICYKQQFASWTLTNI